MLMDEKWGLSTTNPIKTSTNPYVSFWIPSLNPVERRRMMIVHSLRRVPDGERERYPADAGI